MEEIVRCLYFEDIDFRMLYMNPHFEITLIDFPEYIIENLPHPETCEIVYALYYKSELINYYCCGSEEELFFELIKHLDNEHR
jgi:hypothetical protein